MDRALDTLVSEVSEGFGYIFLRFKGRKRSKSRCFTKQDINLSPVEFTEKLLSGFLLALERDLSFLIKNYDKTTLFLDVFRYKGALCALIHDILGDKMFINKFVTVWIHKKVAREVWHNKIIPKDIDKKVANYFDQVRAELRLCIMKSK